MFSKDTWWKHDVLDTDEEDVLDEVIVAMEIESTLRRGVGGDGKALPKEKITALRSQLIRLTEEITAMRARQFYGEEGGEYVKETRNMTIPLHWHHVYLADRVVRRRV